MSQIYIKGPFAPQTPPSGKILTYPKVPPYTYIAVTFSFVAPSTCDLRKALSIIGFELKGTTKWGFWGNFGKRGEDIWWESTSVLRIARFHTSLVQI